MVVHFCKPRAISGVEPTTFCMKKVVRGGNFCPKGGTPCLFFAQFVNKL